MKHRCPTLFFLPTRHSSVPLFTSCSPLTWHQLIKLTRTLPFPNLRFLQPSRGLKYIWSFTEIVRGLSSSLTYLHRVDDYVVATFVTDETLSQSRCLKSLQHVEKQGRTSVRHNLRTFRVSLLQCWSRLDGKVKTCPGIKGLSVPWRLIFGDSRRWDMWTSGYIWLIEFEMTFVTVRQSLSLRIRLQSQLWSFSFLLFLTPSD